MSGSTSTISSKPWNEDEVLAIGIDIGTTQSAVSFTHLYRGGPMTVHRIIGWPGQEAVQGEAKIPSILFYDAAGKPQAFGAECLTVEMKDRAYEEQWQLAEHFKLHLHPETMKSSNKIQRTELPRGVGILQVYADWMKYLFQETKKGFIKRIVNGEETWKKVENSIEFVFGIPNGWDIVQHTMLRKAAAMADLIPASSQATGRKMCFVSEAEASVHFVMLHGDLEGRLEPGDECLVVDAGGSTVDNTLYSAQDTRPFLKLTEKRPSSCIQAGAIFVNKTAEEYFKLKLPNLNLNSADTEETVQAALEVFEKTAKRSFKDSSASKVLDIGGQKLNNPSLGIRRGNWTLPGPVIEGFFSPWVDQIVKDVEEQLSGHSVKHMLVVGGFGESPYLRERLKKCRGASHVNVTLVSEPTAKAVADGAVIWFAKKSVVARATRFAFGTDVTRPYDSKNPEHKGRKVTKSALGERVGNAWAEVVGKGCILTDSEEKSVEFSFEVDQSDSLDDLKTFLFAFDGNEKPSWIITPEGDFCTGVRPVCLLTGDLSRAKGGIKVYGTPNGIVCLLECKIAITFGATEWSASLVWQENGKECRGPASMIPTSFL